MSTCCRLVSVELFSSCIFEYVKGQTLFADLCITIMITLKIDNFRQKCLKHLIIRGVHSDFQLRSSMIYRVEFILILIFKIPLRFKLILYASYLLSYIQFGLIGSILNISIDYRVVAICM